MAEKVTAKTLEKDVKKLERAMISRLGKLALDAGIGDFQISDRELKAGFVDLASRFQSRKKEAFNSPKTQ